MVVVGSEALPLLMAFSEDLLTLGRSFGGSASGWCRVCMSRDEVRGFESVGTLRVRLQ